MSSITRDEQGSFHWTGTIDRQYNRKTIGIIYGATGGMSVFFIVMAFMSYPEMIGVTLLSCLAVMAVVTVVVIPFMKAASGRQQEYEMNENYVRYVGYGKEDAVFHYNAIRRVRIFQSRCMIEIKGLVVSAPFFVSREDFGFVQSYILRHIPENAEVSCE